MSHTMTPTQNQTEPATVSATDADILATLAILDEAVRADGLVCNQAFMWETALDPAHADLKGDQLVVMMAIASLTKKPWEGTRCTHKQIGVRAGHIKKILALAHRTGWPRLMTVLGVK